jgi:uncharacterized membrane protein HdeD (DUF308 family)
MSTHTATDNPYRFNPSSGTSNVLNRALRDNWWLIALRGLLGVIFGVVALLFPGATILSLVLLFSAYMLVDGLFATVAAVRAARERARWGYLLLQGIASIATAVIAFLWPALTVVAFILLIAAWSIVSGCLMLSAAFRIDERHGRWWLAFGGILSLVYGVLLILAPLLGALVLAWWIGAFSLVFGVALIILAFRLRLRRNEYPDAPAAAAT